MPNNETTIADTPESIQQKGIPVITMEVNASNVIPNAVDTTLKNAGEAADAKVVGDKIDEINGTLSDALSDISDLVNAVEGVVSEGGSLDTLDAKIDSGIDSVNQTIDTEVDKLIPKTDISTNLTVSGKVADAKAVGDAISGAVGALNGSTLQYDTNTEQTIKDTVDGLTDRVDELERQTGKDIPLSASVSTSIEDTISALSINVNNIGARTANEIPYVTNGETIKEKVDGINALQPFAVHFDENLSIVRATFNDARITSNHVVTNLAVQHSADISWETADGTLTLNCTAGFPAMDLVLCIPATNN